MSTQYAYTLFLGKKDYNRIIEILENYWLCICDEYKYILYYAFIQIGDNRAAEIVKKEIDNFAQIEEKMKSINR